MRFFVTKQFRKSLEKLDLSIQKQIKIKLKDLSDIKNPLTLALKLQGYKDMYRFRVGDYRVIFRIEQKNLVLLLVKHRKNVYKGL